MNFITVYASNGTLNMPQEQKENFRAWVKEELQIAYPEYEISISEDPHTENFEMYSEKQDIDYNTLKRFIKSLYEKWDRVKEE